MANTAVVTKQEVVEKWYVATAFDTYGNESLPSNEIESLPPGQVKNFKFK